MADAQSLPSRSIGWLAGIRVLDLSQYLPGPLAARCLADMGADVVKVEPPQRDPLWAEQASDGSGVSPIYRLMNAGKRILLLNLKAEHPRALLAQLLAGCDVLIESYRPGVLARLGFDRPTLQAINPQLVHCALSGFGQTGPLRLVSGHDLTYEAVTGNLESCGTATAPAIPYPPMADHAGALQAVVSVLGALFARARGGGGCSLDVSLMESLLHWQAPALTIPQPRGGGIINGGAACYQIYPTADRRFITLSALEAKFWQNFCRAVGRPDWIGRQSDPLPQTELIGELRALFASRPRAEWDALLEPADCCYQAVLSVEEVVGHPHMRQRGLVRATEAYTEVLFPTLVDDALPPARRPCREVTAEEVVAEWSQPAGSVA